MLTVARMFYRGRTAMHARATLKTFIENCMLIRSFGGCAFYCARLLFLLAGAPDALTSSCASGALTAL